MKLSPFLAFTISTCAILPAQQSTPKTDGLDLLKQVARGYADAKSYSLSAIEEDSQTGEYQRHWSKMVLTAAEAPDGRYYFEGHGGAGGAIKASDGKTVWMYHIEEMHYTATPASQTPEKHAGPASLVETSLFSAQNLRRSLAEMTRSVHSASLEPEEAVEVDAKPVRCLVVRIRNADLDRPDPNSEIEKNIWIDKARRSVLRIEELRDTRHVNVPRGPALHSETMTIYTKTELDGTVPDSVFTFVPPPSAVLMAEFPDPRDGFGMSTMTGDMAPSLKLKSGDGKVVPIESFRGKPVLIDFWATWCAPCVAAMPKLAEIFKEGKGRGLVLLSVDQDEDAAKAADFLARKGYDWPNFHDGDGEIAKLMGSSPLPRMVLVDAKGQIVYDGVGGDENRLRSHLAQLGPEFADFAPKAPPSQPCVASK